MTDAATQKELLALFAGLDENVVGAQEALFSNLKFFPGNVPGAVHAPYERFLVYESNLKLLQEADSEKYRRIHKGTPYYFLAWTAFDFRDYERAVFYMDAAVSEDIRQNPKGWHTSPASDFMFLRKDKGGQTAQRITSDTYAKLEACIAKFNAVFGRSLSVEALVSRFVRANLHDKTHRSIVTSLYTFVLEASDRKLQLSLRSSEGGSVEPFLLHLLKGCLILESILKEMYTSMSGAELGSIIKDPFISRDLNYKSGLIDTTAGVRKTLQDIVKHLWPSLQQEDPQNLAITVAYAVRNTTSHSLLWPDVFSQHYDQLFEAILAGILYVIDKKY